jgi:hypothetical protein
MGDDLKYQRQPCSFTVNKFAVKLTEAHKILLERLTSIEKKVKDLDEFKDEFRNSRLHTF